MRSHRIDSTPCCPTCRAALDGATGVDHDNAPKAGDLTVCAYCGSLLTFTHDLQLRLLTDAEITALPLEERGALELASATVQRFRVTRGVRQ